MVGFAFRQQDTGTVVNPASAEETDAALYADTVHGDVVDAVLANPGWYNVFRDYFYAFRPVCYRNDNIGSEQRQYARVLGEIQVVADTQPDSAYISFVDFQGHVAVVEETVDSDIGQMKLAVFANQSGGADEYRGVVIPAFILLQQADDDMQVQPAAGIDDFFRTRARNCLGCRKGLLQAAENVAGQGSFREDRQLSSFPCRLFHQFQDPGKISLFFQYQRFHLHAGDFNRLAHIDYPRDKTSNQLDYSPQEPGCQSREGKSRSRFWL